MGNMKFIDNAIDQRMKDLHTAYLGKVISVNGDTATVQPLGLIKEYGGTPKKQAVVQNVPIAVCKAKKATISFVSSVSIKKETDEETGNITDVTLNQTKGTETVLIPDAISIGDIVICVCCDRDITDARKGKNSLPPAGNHSLSDSVIVGVL